MKPCTSIAAQHFTCTPTHHILSLSFLVILLCELLFLTSICKYNTITATGIEALFFWLDTGAHHVPVTPLARCVPLPSPVLRCAFRLGKLRGTELQPNRSIKYTTEKELYVTLICIITRCVMNIFPSRHHRDPRFGKSGRNKLCIIIQSTPS